MGDVIYLYFPDCKYYLSAWGAYKSGPSARDSEQHGRSRLVIVPSFNRSCIEAYLITQNLYSYSSLYSSILDMSRISLGQNITSDPYKAQNSLHNILAWCRTILDGLPLSSDGRLTLQLAGYLSETQNYSLNHSEALRLIQGLLRVRQVR